MSQQNNNNNIEEIESQKQDKLNDCIMPEACENCNWVCCNGECLNADIPEEPKIKQIICTNCNKNPITNNPYCFEDWCSVCNLMLYYAHNK